MKKTHSKYDEEEAYLRAEKKVKQIMGFYWHLASYVVINIFILVMIVKNTPGNIWHFGTFSTIIFWGIGLAFHAFGVFLKDKLFAKDWENRKIEEFMEKDKRKWE